MAAREELYSKVTPRRDRLQRPGTVKHGSALDVLLSMGFPRARAYSTKPFSLRCGLGDGWLSSGLRLRTFPVL
ncbi:hypothetical protein NN561_018730 [Cricetulus griseus]